MEMRVDQIEEFAAVSSSIPKNSIMEFTCQVVTWEKDLSQPNPFQSSQDGAHFIFHPRTVSHSFISAISPSSVRLKLATADADASKKGEKLFLHKEITLSLLMYQGLEIEDQQYVFDRYP